MIGICALHGFLIVFINNNRNSYNTASNSHFQSGVE